MKVFIVLVHKLNKNNKISKRLKNRLDKFIEEYDNKSYVILSGGKNNSKVSEASKMYEYLLKKSIHTHRLLLEEKSTDTHENIKYSFELLLNNFREKNYELIIISDENHLIKVEKLLKEPK